MRILLVLIFISVFNYDLNAQKGRFKQSLNDNWTFHLGEFSDSSDGERINLPHSWNIKDPFDEEKGYYRGESWYVRSLEVKSNESKKWFLHFEGVNQVAEVYVNGDLAGKHIGGYTAFNVDISDLLKEGENELKVKVDNSYDEHIVPLKGDFNFYGGIYRDVWLISTSKTHFNFSEYGDFGVFISTPKVSEELAEIKVKSTIISNKDSKSKISYKLLSPDKELIFNEKHELTLKAGKQTFNHALPEIENPQLWHPDSPNLYQLEISILDQQDQILDHQIIPIGLRWFKFDPNEGFFINGEHLKLMGTNRHQDYPSKGNALSDQRHINDVKMIKAMGSNFFRTAHYPQDPAVLRASDQLGLLVSMEIPLDHDITDSEVFYENSKHMMVEMIRQYYNHPSIIIWAYMNEMLLGRQSDRDKEIITKIVDFAQVLEDLTREEDSTRYTMIPNHGALQLYHEAGLTEIPMLVGWNLYFGWYEEQLGAGSFLDDFHELVPDKPMLITEFGAGADPRIHSFNPLRFDFSIEWQIQYHQQNLIDIMERSFVAGAAVWNLADFGSENRNDAVPKINSKGLIGFDRKPKNSYFLYQSWLKNEPYLKMASCDWVRREAFEATQPIQFFTNGNSIQLTVNNQKVNVQSFENHLAEWKVNLQNGINTLEAEAKFQDTIITQKHIIDFSLIDSTWISSNTLLVNCGANFFFNDPIENVTWQPEKAFQNKLFGYKGGEIFQPRDRGIGTDRQIFLTQNDPLYQTARVGGEYKFDLTEGQYVVVLHFAEIDKNYNKEKSRIFDILFNDLVVLEDFDLGQIEKFTAYSKKIITQVEDRGLAISFSAKKGEPILNAIEIRKL
ncbi:glycoside hydrolase family 2 TIM barrel-domain containing protein [Marivirga sp.]|uniref:glycoside hydrolase family 2 TIM barrel-domain containing protein n=1 Tax=Marivirga sp. TaxID=2018662 RepID=UPI003DA789F8